MKKEGGMQKRMQSFYFKFKNADGTETVITDSQDGAEKPDSEAKPKKKPQI